MNDQPTSLQTQHPILENTPKQLFYIQRSTSRNTIVYDINMNENGDIQTENPIDIYWIKFSEGGIRKELNYIQRNFAYGINITETNTNEFEFNFYAHKVLTFYIQKSQMNDEIAVSATVNGVNMEVSRIFIEMEEGDSIWFPKIEKVWFEGIDLLSKKNVKEGITP